VNDTIKALPPKGRGPLGAGEMRLAYTMVLPTLLIVMSIVLLPLLANFWISFKPVELGDLRPPKILSNERLKPVPTAVGEQAEISYRLRNTSQRGVFSESTLVDSLPAGLEISGELDSRCRIESTELTCDLGTFEPKKRETLKLTVIATQVYLDDPVNPRASKPVMHFNQQRF